MDIRYGDASDSAEVKTYMAKAAVETDILNSGDKNGSEKTTYFSTSRSGDRQGAFNNADAAAYSSSASQNTNNAISYSLPVVGSNNGFTSSTVAQQQINFSGSTSANTNGAVAVNSVTPVATVSSSSSAHPQMLASLSGGSVPSSISGSGGPSSGYSNIDAAILSTGLFDGGGNYTTMNDDDPGGDDPFPGDTSDPVPLDGGLSILLAVGMGLGIRSFRLSKTKKSSVKEPFWSLKYKFKEGLNTKLFQVMVCMFPHGKAPFLSGKFSK